MIKTALGIIALVSVLFALADVQAAALTAPLTQVAQRVN